MCEAFWIRNQEVRLGLRSLHLAHTVVVTCSTYESIYLLLNVMCIAVYSISFIIPY